MISSIFLTLTGESFDIDTEVNENCKIRRSTRLDSDNDINNSKAANDAKYGTEEENNFKQELEDKQKKDGTVGALDPQEENAEVKPKLPNVNLITESDDIEYEVNDKVLFNKEVWHVIAVTDTTDNLQQLRLTRNGETVDTLSNKVKPDPVQLKTDLMRNQFDFDDKTNLNTTPKNPKVEKMKDLNGKTVECNIVVDSTVLTHTANGNTFKANLKDVMEGAENVRVTVDDNEETWHKDNISIDRENWPYGVIATEEDEPLRKIKVDPLSYVEAKEDNDLVTCTVADKITQYPKRVIRIIAI